MAHGHEGGHHESAPSHGGGGGHGSVEKAAKGFLEDLPGIDILAGFFGASAETAQDLLEPGKKGGGGGDKHH